LKQEINPKVLIAVIAAGIVVLAGVAVLALRAPSAKAVNTAPTTAASGGDATPANQSSHDLGREMAREMPESKAGEARRAGRDWLKPHPEAAPAAPQLRAAA